MNKLQIVLICSLLAASFQNNVHASWFSGSKAVDPAPKEVDPAEQNKNKKDTTAQKKAEQDNAKRKAEEDRIAQQENEAQNRMQETNTQRANQVDTASKTANDLFGKKSSKESSPTSSSWNLSSSFTSAKRPEATVTVEKLQENARNTANEVDPIKKAQQAESIIKTTIEDIEQASGVKVTEADKVEFTKESQSWLKNWSLESFTNWISSCYDWVFSRSSKVEPAPATGSIKLGDASDSSSSVAQPQESTLNKALQDRGNKLTDLNNKGTTLNTNASDFKKTTSALLEKTKAQQSGLTLLNGYGLFKSSAPVAAQ